MASAAKCPFATCHWGLLRIMDERLQCLLTLACQRAWHVTQPSHRWEPNAIRPTMGCYQVKRPATSWQASRNITPSNSKAFQMEYSQAVAAKHNASCLASVSSFPYEQHIHYCHNMPQRFPSQNQLCSVNNMLFCPDICQLQKNTDHNEWIDCSRRAGQRDENASS